MPKLDSGDTAWVLIATGLVLLMTPALALFYAGLVRRRNVLSTLMYSLAALPLVSIQWVLVGHSLAFAPSVGGLIGNFELVGLSGLAGTAHPGTLIPALVMSAFQMMFAVITPALVSGAFVERMKFSTYCVFVLLWSTFVYDPIAHWVWNPEGWLFKLGALDFAGGTVVHISAGVSALVFALVIGRRLRWPHEHAMPHSLPMTLTGLGLLWFGWFGFNGGSSLAANGVAALALMATHVGAAGGAVGWLLVEWLHRRKLTALGLASGVLAGLVAITPASGFVSPLAAIVIGAVAGVLCYGAVVAKTWLRYDDSLDAFGVHGVGGLAGALLTGLFAEKALNPAGNDGLLAGNARQLWVQALACGATLLYAAVVCFLILKVLEKTMGLRVLESEEREGLDLNQHGEEAYSG